MRDTQRDSDNKYRQFDRVNVKKNFEQMGVWIFLFTLKVINYLIINYFNLNDF